MQTLAQYRNLHQLHGLPEEEIERRWHAYQLRMHEANHALETVKLADDPHKAIRCLLPILTADCQRWLRHEAKRATPLPLVNERLDVLARLIGAAERYEEVAR